ncbi:MAG: DUF1273 domain-containing protein, partial [Oscillospiraceae bacterium]|nr:DUF1273 domain-containing protein [Oscillospiraceae bacterium]
MIDKLKVACFSGHRKLPRDCTKLQASLKNTIVDLINRGVVFFGNGGALGFDQLAAETVLRLKEDYPHIRLVMVLPCPPEQQSLKWSAAQKQRYFRILEQADKVRILSPRYTNTCMLDRNRHMVNNMGLLHICRCRRVVPCTGRGA